jgi:hypothetical protein
MLRIRNTAQVINLTLSVAISQLATFKQFCNSLYISHFKKSNLRVRDKRKNLFASDSDTKQGLVPATLSMALSLQVYRGLRNIIAHL